MSYEDLSEVIYLPSVIKGGQGSIQKVKTVPKNDVGLFAAPLGYYSDTTAVSGDQLPWGIASVWANGESNADGVPVDWTGVADAKIAANFSYLNEGESLITDETYTVGAGVSKILLDDPTDLNASVDKFAIVIDSGVAKLDDFNIGDISESLSMSFVDSNYNTILSDETFSLNGVETNTAFQDTVGHGTHVAGTIAAKADGKGVVGVAPGAEVISLKVFGSTGSTTFEIIYDAVSAAIDYVLEDTVDLYDSTGEIKYLGTGLKNTSALNTENTVINLSLGGGLNAQSQPIVDLIESAAAQGVKFAIAGGNSNADVDYTSPAAAGAVENVYTVSAVDKKYVMASFTNYDDDDDGGVNDDVDVAGPGVDVLSYTGQSGSIQAWSGTSMAAPAIAGLLLMTPQDGEGPTKDDGSSDVGDGIQDGEDVFPNYTTFTDPYAVSTLYGGIEPYQDGFNDDDQPDDAPVDAPDDWEEGDDTDNNDYNNESPWNGYDPDNYYFETVGNIKGQLGTYSMSTGPSSVQQATLEEDLGIISGDLDKSMSSYVESESSSFFTGYTDANSTTKNAINATEGSGIKFTGYAKAGDTLVFDYLIASNDYIPYNDFAFVQLKTGDALGNWDGQTELQSLGSIGLDIDNFGTKKGSFSYTLTAEDFNNSNYGTSTAPVDADGDGDVDIDDVVYDANQDGLYDVGDKILNIDGDGNTVAGDFITDVNSDGEISSADLDGDGNLTFGGVYADSIAILKGDASEQFVLDYLAITSPGYTATYSYALPTADLLTYTDLEAGDFAFAYEGVEEFGDYVLDIDNDGEITELDKVYDFSGDGKITDADLASDTDDTTDGITVEDLDGDLLPTVGVSTTYGTDSFFMSAANATTAGLTGESYYVYTSNTLDIAETGFDGTSMNDLATEGVDPIYQGFFDLSAGVTDAIDGWVDTTMMVKGMGLIPEGEEGSLIDETEDGNYVEGTLAWSEDLKLGNGTVSEGVANMSTGSGSVGQSVLEAIIGLEDGVLDTDLNDTKYAIDATSGSGAYATTFAQIGDVISFDYSFDTNDYSPYKDFSWFSVNDTVEKIVALGEDVENFGKAKGTITYTLTAEDFDGDYTAPFTEENGDENDGGGKLTLGFGVMDALDTCVDSYLKISNVFVYNPENVDEIPDEFEEATTDEIINDFSEFETGFFGNVSSTFNTVDDIFFDFNGDATINWEDAVWDFDESGTIDDNDLIVDLSADGFIDINDVVVDTDENGIIEAADADADGNYTYFVDNLDTEAAIGFVASEDENTGLLYVETYGDEEIVEILGEFMQVDSGSDIADNTPYLGLTEVAVSYDELSEVVLSTQYNYDGTAYTGDMEEAIAVANTLESDDIEWYTGLESGILSTSLNGTKNSIDATTGSAITLSGVGAVGDTFSFDFAFASSDYNPFEDFAYVSVNEEAYVLQNNVDPSSATYGQTAVVTNLYDAIGESDFSGSFSYTLTKADLGGNFGEFILSAGVMNALDNAVETTLTLSNFDYSPGELLETGDDGGILDDLEDVYEDDISAYFDTIGDVYVESDVYGGFSLSTAGNVASDSSLEDFAQLANKTLDKAMLINDGWTDKSFSGKLTKDKINATEGSAVQFGAKATAGDTAYFYYYFETNDYTPYADFSWYSVGDKAYMIAGVGTNVDNWGAKEGFIEYTITENDLNDNGEFVLTVGVVDALDGAVESNIDIWGFGITGSGEQTPGYEAPEGIENDDYGSDWDDDYFEDNDDFYFQEGSFFDVNGDGLLTDADLILDYNNDGIIGYQDMLMQVDTTDGGNVNDILDALDLVVGDGGEGTVKFLSVGEEDKNINFAPIETTDANKGFFITLENEADYYDLMIGEDYVDSQLDYAGEEYIYFDFLSADNSAYVFLDNNTQSTSVALEGTDYGFISLTDDDYYEDTDGDGYEDGYWEDYDPDQDSNYADQKPDDTEEVYEDIDIEMLGNTFQVGESVVMSTGGGAIDQYDIENALGLKDGALDEAFATYDQNGNVVEVTKEAIDATQGSAAYDTVEVSVGDVINFGFTFGTDDYIPFQDFAFFALNGQAHSIATVGVEVDSYGEYSDVYNYVISSDDLGGANSGVVTIGVGIMDAIDYCVDSYIEVYDFQISGDEKYDDSTNDGIVDGESAYSINTAVGVSAFNVATSNTVKLSFKGKSVSAETSAIYDVVASAASTKVSGGYQVLLEGTGKKDGKWFVHQTDAYGAIINNKQSGWKSEAKAVDLGWEQLFNFDINGDSILEGTADSDSLMLYSAQTGGITISNYTTTIVGEGEEAEAVTETSTVSQGDIDILAATPSKADFTTFSTPGETLQMLVAGAGENAGKFQVWTTLEDGTVIEKKGYTDWTKDEATNEWTKTEYDWFTSEQAVAVGLEDDFAYDIDSNGVLSGGTSYKILGPNGGLVIKNAKGIALDDVTAPYYSPLAAVKTKKGYDLALEGATGSDYEGLYSIWKTNEYGKVIEEAEWITKDQFVSSKKEEYFNVDVNSDGLIGVSNLLDDSDASDTKLAVGEKNSTVVQTTNDSGVIVSTVLKNNKGKNVKVKFGSFTMLDAETVSGVDENGDAVDLNQVVFKAKNNKSIQIYNYSDDWSTYESKSKIKAKTDEFYQAEIAFNQDLNNDGIIATTDGVDENGNDIYVAKALVASEEDLTDMYKNDANQVLFTYGQTDDDGNAIIDEETGEQLYDEFVFQSNKGKSIKAKQGKFEVADVLATDDLKLKVAFNSGKALKIYTLADPAAVEGEPVNPEGIKISGIETISSKKAGFFEQEIAFNFDFNGDGIVGNVFKTSASAAVGDFTAQYDYQNKAFYDDASVATSYELQNKKGKQLNASYGQNELSGVGEIGDDNTFTAVYKNSKNDMLSIYEMTDVLDSEGAATGNKKQIGKIKKVKASALNDYFQYETDFGIDFNEDGFIGKDIAGALDADGNVIGDGSFDDNDLITGETKGQVEQYTDLAGNIYALNVVTDASATALTVDDEAFVDGAYKKLKGWSVLGLDTTLSEDGSVDNIGIFGKGNKFKMVSFGSDWNFDTSKDSSDSITNYNAKKLVSNNIEDLFVQDLNKDSFI